MVPKINPMKKFSKGNWMVADYQNADNDNRVLAVWTTNDSRCVCLVSPKETETEGDMANAQLIAVAPEMYEAMQEFCDKVDRGEARSIKTYTKFKEILSKVQ